MKITVPRPVEIEASHIVVDVPLRYEEDVEELGDLPCITGKRLRLNLGLDDGKIRGWMDPGRDIEFHLKVVDEGTYTLAGPDGEALATITDNYVPNSVVPGEFGDYLICTVQRDGSVLDQRGRPWRAAPEAVIEAFFPVER